MCGLLSSSGKRMRCIPKVLNKYILIIKRAGSKKAPLTPAYSIKKTNVMNTNDVKPVVITEEDYQLLKQYISPGVSQNEMSLSAELKRAVIVNKDAFPRHT